jgi:hypothetical protein
MSQSSTDVQDDEDETIEGEDAPEQEDEESEEEETEESEDDEDPEIDFGDFKVKKSEAKAGYMKDADYRRKTAEVAEAKREAQAISERAQAERSHYANHLDAVLGRLQTQLIGDQRQLAELAQSDPAAWVAENAKFQQRYADYQAALAERQALGQRQQQAELASQTEYIRNEQKLLQEKLPEWNDHKVKTAESQGIAQFLLDRGYTQEDLAALQDHRALLIVRDAWKATQAAQARVTAQTKQAKPQPGTVIKPGAPKAVKPNLALKEANERLRRNPDSLEALGAFVSASQRQR